MTADRVYPLPEPDDDRRFTVGLTLDVAETLVRHGYPSLRPGDVVELRQTIYRFLYRQEAR